MISSFLLLLLYIRKEDKTSRYIYAIAIWTLICFSMTEILSIFGAISTSNLRRCWLMLDILLLVLNIVKYRMTGLKEFKNLVCNIRMEKKFVIWGLFSVTMLLMVVKTVPYNWDSMVYHLPRIFHWLQNGSVEYYATAIDRQVSSPLGGAYVNLHVYALSNGSDRFVNLLQCCSFLTNGVLVYCIAKKIGCSKKYCNIATLLYYSMPIAFAEALTTQVDNFSALWVLATVYLLLDFLHYEDNLEWNKKTLGNVIVLSLCVAFGYLTKPSIGIGVLFFAIWLLIMVIRRKDRVLPLLLYLCTAIAILAVLLLPGFVRNVAAFDTIMAPGVGQRQLVGTLQPKKVMVNFAKNITFNMPTAWLYDSSTILYEGVSKFSEMVNVDINDPTISEDGRAFWVHEPQEYGHDTAINPIIVWLMIICIFLWSIKNRKKNFFEMRNSYFVVATISFLTFCALLRWEPFVSRYMISYLAVLCPALVGQLEMFFYETETVKHKGIEARVMTLIGFLCVTELLGLGICHGRIALTESRNSGYFRNYEDIEALYREVADVVNSKNYKNIGVIIGDDPYEYPLIVMLEDYSRLEHVNVTNATGVYEDFEFVPEAIICIKYELKGNELKCHGAEYKIEKVIEGTDGNVKILEMSE